MKGWTIIETLIILAIIGILLAIIFGKQEDQPSHKKPVGVNEFFLDDGTRCVRAYNSVTCDWKK